MLKRSLLVALTVGLLLTPTIAALSQDTEPSRSDLEITARVKGLLARNDEVEARQINVETERGIVQLSGFVDSERAKQVAGETARGVVGVTEVRNELIVGQGGSRSVGRATDDTIIEARVKSELATNAGLAPATNVKVEVRSGVVQLSGFVASNDQKQQAERIARQVQASRKFATTSRSSRCRRVDTRDVSSETLHPRSAKRLSSRYASMNCRRRDPV